MKWSLNDSLALWTERALDRYVSLWLMKLFSLGWMVGFMLD